jgi:hypothetical protein
LTTLISTAESTQTKKSRKKSQSTIKAHHGAPLSTKKRETSKPTISQQWKENLCHLANKKNSDLKQNSYNTHPESTILSFEDCTFSKKQSVAQS